MYTCARSSRDLGVISRTGISFPIERWTYGRSVARAGYPHTTRPLPSVWTLRVETVGPCETICRTETRVATTDAERPDVITPPTPA
jgi:hypothetical protein